MLILPTTEEKLSEDESDNIETAVSKTPNAPKEGSSLFWSVCSCAMYSFCSVAMVLANKAISTSAPMELRHKLPQFSIVWFQCGVAVILVHCAKLLGIIEYPAFSFKTARAWLPVNIFFVGMLVSGFMSLVYVSVPMVTIFKNMTNIMTVFGDWYLYSEKTSWLTVAAVAIMTAGALLAGANDLEFHAIGYIWMAINCCCTSGYILYMRYASTTIKLPRFGMVFYNNVLAMALLAPLCIVTRELEMLSDNKLMNVQFLLWNVAAGFLGFYWNFASLWCVSSTSATTYAIVGSLNKVPITVLGFTLFEAKMTSEGFFFVVMATLGGFLYAYAKLPS